MRPAPIVAGAAAGAMAGAVVAQSETTDGALLAVAVLVAAGAGLRTGWVACGTVLMAAFALLFVGAGPAVMAVAGVAATVYLRYRGEPPPRVGARWGEWVSVGACAALAAAICGQFGPATWLAIGAPIAALVLVFVPLRRVPAEEPTRQGDVSAPGHAGRAASVPVKESHVGRTNN